MNKVLIMIFSSIIFVGCSTNNSSLDSGLSKTKMTGQSVVYSQNRF